MGDIDASYVQHPEHRPQAPKANDDEVAGEIPVIDLSISDVGELVSQVGSACEKWGVFHIINYGMPIELHQKMDMVIRKFFKQSMEEKIKVKRSLYNPYGYHDNEHIKNVRDWKETYGLLLKEPTEVPVSPDPDNHEMKTLTNRWPENPPEFRETVEEYLREAEKVAYKLLELIALSLGLPADRFREFFSEKQTSIVRLNYYPPCPSPHLALGIGRHKDSGPITLLAQDPEVVGLEFQRKSDGEWITVKPIPYGIVVIVSSALQIWSNDKYESLEHRAVVNSEKERVSYPLFMFPDSSALVKPLEELVSDENPARYREHNWGKFYANRIHDEFKKHDNEDLEHRHYKIVQD